jgi:hypothetical protein
MVTNRIGGVVILDTWKCHICGDERPDDKISVFKHSTTTPGGIRLSENVRYCNDRKKCIEAAPNFHFIEV